MLFAYVANMHCHGDRTTLMHLLGLHFVHVGFDIHSRGPEKKAGGVVGSRPNSRNPEKGVNMTSGTTPQKICSGL